MDRDLLGYQKDPLLLPPVPAGSLKPSREGCLGVASSTDARVWGCDQRQGLLRCGTSTLWSSLPREGGHLALLLCTFRRCLRQNSVDGLLTLPHKTIFNFQNSHFHSFNSPPRVWAKTRSRSNARFLSWPKSSRGTILPHVAGFQCATQSFPRKQSSWFSLDRMSPQPFAPHSPV